MKFTEYTAHIEEILNAQNPQEPYNDAEYFNFTKLNWSRMNRWFKHGEIKEEVKNKIKGIAEPQTWVLIAEPWCGDAAHSVPFIKMLADLNPNIQLKVQLRDSGSEIDNYLTNGGKSIPKLIIRDHQGKDIATWGPRPANGQAFFLEKKESGMPMDDVKEALQQWYNDDKGASIQEELVALV